MEAMLQCLVASVMHAKNVLHDLDMDMDMKIRVSEISLRFLCRVGQGTLGIS